MHNSGNLKGFANASGAREGGKKTSPDALVTQSGANTYYHDQEAIRQRQEHLDEQKSEREEKTHKILRKLGAIAAIATLSGGLLLAGKMDKDTLTAEQKAKEETTKNNDPVLHFNINIDPESHVATGQLISPDNKVYHYEGVNMTEDEVKDRLTRMMDEDKQKEEAREAIGE